MTKYCTTSAVRFETLNDFYGFATYLKDSKWKCEAVNVVVGVAVYHEGGGGYICSGAVERGRSFRDLSPKSEFWSILGWSINRAKFSVKTSKLYHRIWDFLRGNLEHVNNNKKHPTCTFLGMDWQRNPK